MQDGQQSMNSDLSCHELSKTRWEGQSGDDQSYHSGEDKPAVRENIKKGALVKQTAIISLIESNTHN